MGNTVKLLNNISLFISGVKTRLISISENSESEFVKLGEDLQSVYSDADKLKCMTIKATGLIGKDSKSAGTLLSDISSFTNDSIEELDTLKNNVTEIFPRFESCLKNIEKLHDICPDILKIAKRLNIVALNISVESSRTKESEEMFNIFMKEIRELAKRVNDIAHMIKEDSAASVSRRDNDLNEILKRMNQIDNMADEASDTVSENIKRIDKLMHLSLRTLKESEKHSHRISSLVGDVVMAIQFHDIARQQIEHIIEAFQDLEHLIMERESSTPNQKEDLSILGKAGSLIHLQGLQMLQILSEIEDAHKKIATAFKEIGKEASDLVAEVNGLGSDHIGIGDRERALDLLLSDFKKLEVITGNGERLSERIDGAMKLTGETASKISGYLSSMQEIGTDLHIKSVNALLMSKKLGNQGIALSVLAQHVTDVSKGSDHFVNEVIEIIKKIQRSALELQDISSRKDMCGADRGKLITERVNRITGIYDRFITETEDSYRLSMKLKEKLLIVESNLTFLNEMKSRAKECIEEMNGLVISLSPYMENDKNTDELSILMDRYTMEVERNIHQRSVGNNEDIPDNNAPDMNFEGLGDNVELF